MPKKKRIGTMDRGLIDDSSKDRLILDKRKMQKL